MASLYTRFLNHTQRRAIVGRTPLDEWSARRRDLYQILAIIVVNIILKLFSKVKHVSLKSPQLWCWVFRCSEVLHCVADNLTCPDDIFKRYCMLKDCYIARYTARLLGRQESLTSKLRQTPKHDRPALSGLNPIMETAISKCLTPLCLYNSQH
jgi:hypothetical protein